MVRSCSGAAEICGLIRGDDRGLQVSRNQQILNLIPNDPFFFLDIFLLTPPRFQELDRNTLHGMVGFLTDSLIDPLPRHVYDDILRRPH